MGSNLVPVAMIIDLDFEPLVRLFCWKQSFEMPFYAYVAF